MLRVQECQKKKFGWFSVLKSRAAEKDTGCNRRALFFFAVSPTGMTSGEGEQVRPVPVVMAGRIPEYARDRS
jgi:hypothetical protein